MGVLMESSQANQTRANQGFRPVDSFLQTYEKQNQISPNAKGSRRHQPQPAVGKLQQHQTYQYVKQQGFDTPYQSEFQQYRSVRDEEANAGARYAQINGVPVEPQYRFSTPVKEMDVEYSHRYPTPKIIVEEYSVENDRVPINQTLPYYNQVTSDGGSSPLRRKYEGTPQEEVVNCVSVVCENRNGITRPSSPVVTSMPPPKKKWIKNYMEEEPCPPCVPRNGLAARAPPPSAPIAIPPPAQQPQLPLTHPLIHHQIPSALQVLDHDQPRARSNSNGSGGGRAAGTREVHNKLEKNRRAHLKECFELLKRQLPASPDDKKSSNLSILDSAIRYIQLLKRRERECEHEMERLAREKIASQQRLAALRRGSPITPPPRLHLPSNHDGDPLSEGEEVMVTSRVSPLIMASPGSSSSLSMSLSEHHRLSPSPPGIVTSVPTSLDLSTKSIRPTLNSVHQVLNIQPQVNSTTIYPSLDRTPPLANNNINNNGSSPSPTSRPQIITTPFQVHTLGGGGQKQVHHQQQQKGLPTLTVTTVNQVVGGHQKQQLQVTNDGRKILTASPVNGQTTIVHPAQLQLPISQVVNGTGIVMSPAIQMFYATPQTLRVLQGQGGAVAPIDLPSTAANSPIQRVREVQKIGEAGIGGVSTTTGISVNGRTITNSAGQPMQQNNHHIAIKPQPEDPQTSIMMNGLTPLLVSKGGTHIIAAPPHLAGKVMSGPIIKASVNQHQIPLTVNAQYLGAAGTVKPVVVVSTSNGAHPPHSQSS